MKSKPANPKAAKDPKKAGKKAEKPSPTKGKTGVRAGGRPLAPGGGH